MLYVFLLFLASIVALDNGVNSLLVNFSCTSLATWLPILPKAFSVVSLPAYIEAPKDAKIFVYFLLFWFKDHF